MRDDPSSQRPILAVGLGEILWDRFVDEDRFGGAPANFACHALALGARAAVVSCVGQDELGDRALRILESRGVATAAIQRRPEATGVVDIELDSQGVAAYRFADNSAWDHLSWTPELQEVVAAADVVCFGTLGQRSAASRGCIERLVAAAPRLRIFDVNLRQAFYDADCLRRSLTLANSAKLNEDELPIVARLCDCEAADDLGRLRSLQERFELERMALTRGAAGSLLLERHAVSQRSGMQVEVRDTVGAGDAFTASWAWGTLNDWPLEAIHELASRVAAFVCTQAGATPPLDPELLRDAN